MTRYLLFVSLCLQLLLTNQIFAEEKLRISIGKLPIVAESREKGAFIELAKLLKKSFPAEVEYDVYPFSRSLLSVMRDETDMHLPFIRSKQGAEILNSMNLEYAYEPTNFAPFALYYNKGNTKVEQWIASGFDLELAKALSLETEKEHTIFFDDVTIEGNACIACMLRKLVRERIDGVIFAAREIDDQVKLEEGSNIQSVLYKNFEASPVFQKTEKGILLNKKVSTIIKELRENGEL